jgi:hypothetical protein
MQPPVAVYETLRVTIRTSLDDRLKWFRVENADGHALELRARPDTSPAEMESARQGAMAMLGGVQ